MIHDVPSYSTTLPERQTSFWGDRQFSKLFLGPIFGPSLNPFGPLPGTTFCEYREPTQYATEEAAEMVGKVIGGTYQATYTPNLTDAATTVTLVKSRWWDFANTYSQLFTKRPGNLVPKYVFVSKDGQMVHNAGLIVMDLMRYELTDPNSLTAKIVGTVK